MLLDPWRGFNRLFLALTIAWAMCCAVLYPIQMQFDGQRRAVSQYDKDVKMCQQLEVERPEWDMTKNCFERIDENEKNALALYSLKKFWIYDVVFWRIEIATVILPPLFVYAFALLSRWIWRGFTSRTGESA